MTYETAYSELQKILQRVEHETLSLTELETNLRRAAELVAFCKTKLHETTENTANLFDGEA